MSAPADPDRPIAGALRLRVEPPPVARLSRKAVVLLAGVACAGLAAAAGWGLAAHPRVRPGAAPPADAPANPPSVVTRLPSDYAHLPPGTPRLGPPLPGGLGRPILASGAPSRLADGAAPAAPAGREAAESAHAQEADQAARSRLFGPDAFAARRSSEIDAALTEAGGSKLASRPGLPDAASLGRAGEAGAPGEPQTGSASHQQILQAGTIIRAALITGIRSDLPGLVTAQVTQDVLDSATGRWTLVPQGSRLVGSYASRTTFGQERVQVEWTRLILPDGRSVDLGGAPGADAEGYAGLSDRVDHRWGALAGASAVSTLLGIGTELGSGQGDSAVLQALRLGAATTVNQAGQQIVGKALDVGPRLEIRPGFPLRVLLTKDIALPPWRAS